MKRSLMGRKADSANNFVAEPPILYRVCNRSFPVRFRKRRAFLERMATLYVSRYRRRKPISKAPVIMAMSQNVQRHPLACDMNPPMMGPSIGAIKGVIPITAIARPRFSFGNKSPTMHEFNVVDATVNPRRKRNAISIFMLWLRAATAANMINRILAVWYTKSLPSISDNGPMMIGPTTSPSSQIETKIVESNWLDV